MISGITQCFYPPIIGTVDSGGREIDRVSGFEIDVCMLHICRYPPISTSPFHTIDQHGLLRLVKNSIVI